MRVNAAVREEEIAAFIRRYYLQHDRLPSEKDIVAGTGIPAGSVHRCLIRLREKGEFSREGGRRGAKPEDLDHVSNERFARVSWGTLIFVGEIGKLLEFGVPEFFIWDEGSEVHVDADFFAEV